MDFAYLLNMKREPYQPEVDTVLATASDSSVSTVVEEESIQKNLHDSPLYHLVLPDGGKKSVWEGHFFPPWCSAQTLIMLVRASAGLKG
jgi:hypothetical protein